MSAGDQISNPDTTDDEVGWVLTKVAGLDQRLGGRRSKPDLRAQRYS